MPKKVHPKPIFKKGRTLKKYILNVGKPKRITFWHKIQGNFDILLGQHHSSRLNVIHNKINIKKTSAMCIVAPIYAKLRRKSKWKPHEINTIIANGIELHHRTKAQFKIKTGEDFPIQPSCIYPNFLVENHYISVVIGRACLTGDLNRIEDVIPDIENLIKENEGIIFICNGTFLSCWFSDKLYFWFCPLIHGAKKNNKVSFILRSGNLKDPLNYLNEYLNLRGHFSVYCLKVLSVKQIPLQLNAILQERRHIMLKSQHPEDEPDIYKLLEDNLENKYELSPKFDKVEGAKNAFELPFSKDYNNSYYNDRGFLSATFFINEPLELLHANISCAMFLHHLRALLWSVVTVDDVLKYGHLLYEESEEQQVLEHPIWTQRVAMPISFGKKNFDIIFEKIIFGDVTTEESHIFSLKQGVQMFFKQHDLGLIWGPQCQLIWAESGLYFTFSPKERDAAGRKWTRVLSKQLKSNQNKFCGTACVSWFKTPAALADAYVSNIALKHRKDSYRIVKLKIIEIQLKSDDFNNFVAIGENKWRIIGQKTICDLIKTDQANLMFAKGFCIGCANSLYASVINVTDWTSKSVDDILDFGNKYYDESVALKPAIEEKFDWKDLKKTYMLLEKRFQVLIIPCAVQGSVFYKTKGGGDLFEEMKLFFEDYQYGLFVCRDITIPIWADNSFFYLLFPYDKIFGKNNTCFCSPENVYAKVYGHAYVLRFKILADMHQELLNCLSMEDQDKFCIHSIEGKDRPPLLNYTKFGENGAQIRPFDSLHEGSSLFNVRADKQTYANVIVCLCFALITRPLEWNKDDLFDILKIGDGIYCGLVANLQECQEKFYYGNQRNTEIRLNQVNPQIGMNKFTFTQNPQVGVFKLIPVVPGEGESLIEIESELEDEEDVDTNIDEDGGEEIEQTNDLKTIFEHWEIAETIYAIVDSKFFVVAVWKKDLVYFLFDPKASEEDGKLNKRRLKDAIKDIEGAGAYGDDPTIIPHEGAAYVAYFYDLESFVEHILSKVPEEYIAERFTLNVIAIRTIPVPLADLDFKKLETVAFKALSPNQAIIRASISQDETIFQNQNCQESANCIVALAFGHTTAPTKWNIDTLDIILKYGDRLYIKSLEEIKIKNPSKACSNEKLTLEDILTTVNIYKIKFHFKITGKYKNCLSPNLDSKDVKKYVNNIKGIDTGVGLVLLFKGMTNTIWKAGPQFYLFDPKKTDPEGMVSQQGSASLSRFGKVDLLIEFVIKKFLCLPGKNSFELYTFEVSKTLPASLPSILMEKFNFSAQLPSNQVVFVKIENDMKILEKNLEPNEFDLPKDFACLAALLNSNLEFVELWNYTVFKKINLLGHYLQKQLHCKRRKECADDEKHLEEINYSIKIDNVICKIVVNHVTQVAAVSEHLSNNLYLKQGLEHFFLDRKSAIITGGNDKSYAIWLEGALFYMFWINTSINKAMVQATKDWKNLYKIISDEAELEIPSVAYQIKYVQITKIKMWSVCEKDEKAALAAVTDLNRAVNKRSCQCKEDPLAEICRTCYFNQFQKKTEIEKKVLAKYRGNFVPFSQGIEMLISCEILRNQKFFATENFMPNIKATCIVAAGMAFIKDPLMWTKKTISKILLSGNELFMNSVAVSRTNNLEITEMEQSFHLYHVSLQIVALPPTQELAEKDNLVTVLTYILRKHKAAYLIAPDNFAITFIFIDFVCYLFYAGSLEKFMEDPSIESACLIRFDSVARAIDFVLKKKKIETNCLFLGPIVVMRKY